MSMLPVDPNRDEREEEVVEKYKDYLVDIHSKLSDKAAAYTNLIMLGGYAGAFTIWSYTKAQLSVKAHIACAILLGFSLTVFISFEVYKMIINAALYTELRALLKLTPTSFFEKLSEFDRENDRKIIMQTKSWTVCLFFTVIPALGAVAILFYNFLLILLSGTR